MLCLVAHFVAILNFDSLNWASGKRVVMIGDSNMRFQYLNLAHFLCAGRWWFCEFNLSYACNLFASSTQRSAILLLPSNSDFFPAIQIFRFFLAPASHHSILNMFSCSRPSNDLQLLSSHVAPPSLLFTHVFNRKFRMFSTTTPTHSNRQQQMHRDIRSDSDARCGHHDLAPSFLNSSSHFWPTTLNHHACFSIFITFICKNNFALFIHIAIRIPCPSHLTPHCSYSAVWAAWFRWSRNLFKMQLCDCSRCCALLLRFKCWNTVVIQRNFDLIRTAILLISFKP